MQTTPLLINLKDIENRIFTIRGKQVMIDRDLAELFNISTKALNQSVKRNLNRFPDSFKIQLNDKELNELVTNCDQFKILKHSYHLPFAFTEYGVSMLSSILKSDIAVMVSIQIIEAFVEMRKTINKYGLTDLRLNKLEQKQIMNDQKFEELFKALDNNSLSPDKGIFFDGQIFDAYIFVNDLIRSAKTSIVLIDNYIDDTVLSMFSKKEENVSIKIYTKSISRQLQLDVSKFNAQYPKMEIKVLTDAHDRFLIIDDKEVYHIGASIKDLGKKWFAFSKMNAENLNILNKLN